jgi:hypothetical protein
MIDASDFSFTRLHTEIHADDHTGLFKYFTKFTISSNNTRLIPIGILYQGHTPSSLEIRQAIRDYILNLHIATEEKWKSILPDIFVVAEFYLIPLWNHKINRLERELYPSILNVQDITHPVELVFPDTDKLWISLYTELLLNSKLEVFTLSIPDPLNHTDYRSILTLHPTFQNHSPDSSTFKYMESHTQDFGRKFSKAISILSHESYMTDEFLTNTFNDKEFISFTVSGVEYHILHLEEYPTS